ncbi:MAG: hypothetical protein P0Y53_24475 [Candidatus Pseudobacter hemicellulosilyticus]|uniref:IPT/TIG domain-containing protein n=1 Tax=Candidatus Pseudobacter hemicellulosilyticus TaxID=3121375 RepID=A0AAJ5WT39_9BACT|nr:MAG: hypothetical protein P0Y53_24475 [Pseudobacter sp.]
MNKEFIPVLLMGLLFGTTILSCKKDKEQSSGLPEQPPVLSRLSQPAAQAGEKLTLYGQQLVQGGWQTEVFVNDRPSEILEKTTDSIVIRIPEKSKSGKVTVTLSSGSLYSAAEGPELNVLPTPLIKGIYPAFGTAGETMFLITENFSQEEDQNQVFLGNQLLTITGRMGKDTLEVRMPDNAVNGVLSWRTYTGPAYSMKDILKVRQTSYPVSTVKDWIREDPAFSYMDMAVNGFPDILGDAFPNYQGLYDVAMTWLSATDQPCTVFLANDMAYTGTDISKEQFRSSMLGRPFDNNYLLLAAIVPGQSLGIADLQPGEPYNSLYTMKMHWWPDGTEDANFFTVMDMEDGRYVMINNKWGDMRQPVKMVKEHKVGNATIIELAGIPGFLYW